LADLEPPWRRALGGPFCAPGRATSYFYGYTRLSELRKDAEKQMGSRFGAQKFHDFILAQGLLPPALLRKAVLEQFVNSETVGTKSR
jgi:uncharacterized protein (DUF885 family)